MQQRGSGESPRELWRGVGRGAVVGEKQAGWVRPFWRKAKTNSKSTAAFWSGQGARQRCALSEDTVSHAISARAHLSAREQSVVSSDIFRRSISLCDE